jgi:hypothetical protein
MQDAERIVQNFIAELMFRHPTVPLVSFRDAADAARSGTTPPERWMGMVAKSLARRTLGLGKWAR